MPKPKVESICIGKMYGEKQEIFINGNCHEYSIYRHENEILNELFKYYDFSYQDEKDFEVMW